jgi:prepilin-type N-terminal cleavage/methylation domain-containing protein
MRFKLETNSLRQDRNSAIHPAGPVIHSSTRRGDAGFTLMEVLIALFIVAVVFGSIINGYLVSAIRGQWTGYSLAAQSLALQTIEQARSAVWDGGSGKNELTSLAVMNPQTNGSTFTGYTTNILDVPWKGTNAVVATNWISVRMFYWNNNSALQVQLQMVRVDTVWPFTAWGKHSVNYYTNTICNMIAPDNRDPRTLGAIPPPGT